MDGTFLRKGPYHGGFRRLSGLLLSAFFVALAAMIASNSAHGAGPGDRRSIAKLPADLNKTNKDFELYLDRLMLAESDGRDFLKNPRSSALGPYQFIKGTFLYVVRRRFADRVAGLSIAEILALRTNRAFAREVIAEYSRELARHLNRHGLSTTYGNLRLAYLLGPTGATRVLSAKSDVPVRQLISQAAVAANPFLKRMTPGEIIARAHRDISMERGKHLAVAKQPAKKRPQGRNHPKIAVRCNLARASCRRWLALRKKQLAKKHALNVANAEAGKAR